MRNNNRGMVEEGKDGGEEHMTIGGGILFFGKTFQEDIIRLSVEDDEAKDIFMRSHRKPFLYLSIIKFDRGLRQRGARKIVHLTKYI